MDPFILYHSDKYIPDSFNMERGTTATYCFVTKARQIIRYRPDKIILGSSIVDHGFRIRGSTDLWFCPIPENTKHIVDALPADAKDFYNAGIRGGGAGDALVFLKHAYTNNPHLKHVVLGLEWFRYSDWAPADPTCNPTEPLGKRYVSLAFFLEYTLSPFALKESLGLYENDHPLFKRYTDIIGNGWSSLSDHLISLVHRWAGEHEPASPTAPFISVPVPEYPSLLKAETYSILREYLHAAWFFGRVIGNKELVGTKPPQAKRALDDLREIVGFCHEHNIELKVYLSPHPPIFWAMMRRFGLQEKWEQWFHQAADITPIYDAAALIDFSPNVEKYFDSDTLHFDEHGGEVLLPALTQKPVNPALVLTDTHNVDEEILWRKTALEQWRAMNPNMAKAIDNLDDATVKVLSSTKLSLDMLPTPFEPHYRGYILYRYMDSFIALPEGEKTPFDLYQLMNGGFPLLIKGSDINSITRQIDARRSSAGKP